MDRFDAEVTLRFGSEVELEEFLAACRTTHENGWELRVSTRWTHDAMPARVEDWRSR